jgi:predicted Zn-dependent protease
MSTPRRRLACIALIACSGMLLAAGCSSTPKSSKKKRTILMTEYDDASIGREASVDVKQQMGVLDDPDLNAYVTEIGLKLLRGLPRRSFRYEFAVVDMIEPNAFALPGGYVFISRGLLALTNSEDELACVIGHEIIHAHHRHAAAQQQLSKRVNPLAMPWNRASKMAGYGRDMERDADKGGQILCAAAGYDPMGMSTFMARLGQTERLRVGYARMPSFFDSHPGSTERAAVNAVRASELRWKRDPLLGDTQLSLLAKIDGLAVGPRPQAGMFIGSNFIHPDMDFHLRFPAGWLKSNSNQAVGALSPRGTAAVFLTADTPPGDPRQTAEAWLEKVQAQQRVNATESKPVKVGHIDAWRLRLNARGLDSYVTFIPYRAMTWRITGVTPSSQAGSYLGLTLATARSFRPLTPEERNSLHGTFLRVATARPGEGLAELSTRTGSAFELADLAATNGIFIDHRFSGGEFVKIARSEPYVPATPSSEN